MRTARTIGIAEDGKETIIHPKTTPVTKQIADCAKMVADGLPKQFVLVELQTSDGRVKEYRNGISAGVKAAQDRAAVKLRDREKILNQQAEARKKQEAEKAKEAQKRIDAANAQKEAAKKAVARSA